jgi:CRISPR/Cas system-associated endonuclease/helicase Cas3
MSWIDKYMMTKNVTELGKRESQILVLDNMGISIEKIQTKIEDLEGDRPEKSTIRSIKSKLKRKKIRQYFTNIALDDSVDKMNLKSTNEDEFSDKITTYAYCGMIGCGKTVASARDAYNLSNNIYVDKVDIINILDDKTLINAAHNDKIESHNLGDCIDIEVIMDRIYDCISKYEPNKNYVLFIDQAHYITTNEDTLSKIIDYIKTTDANVSLRLVSQTYKEFINMKHGIDFYNIFRIESADSDIISKYDLNISPSNLHVGTEKRPWSEVIRVDTNKNSSKIRCVYLSEDEKEILMG